MDKKLISRRVANNMLEFLYDPTKIPVDKRLYFRAEEILQNQSYDKARAEGVQAYHDQKKNSDFYPTRNQREASSMDRRTLIASLDVLSQSFDESDPIGTDLRTMAYAVSEMTNEELSARLAGEGMSVEAKKKAEMVKCPECGTKVLKATGYCLKCQAKTIKKDKDEDEGKKDDKKEDKKEDKKKDKKDDKKKGKKAGDMDFWSKAACEAVQRALVADVCPKDDEPKQPVVPEVKPEEKKAEEQPVVPPTQEESKDEKPAKQECKAADAPAPVPIDAPAVPAPDAPVPTPVPAPEDKPKKKKDDEDKDDKEAKVVDTNVLVANVEGIEMLAGMIDVGDLTAAEKAQLDQLFS
jgi:hypothetical protein